MQKGLLAIIILVALGAVAYLFSGYLVSRLDGTGGVLAPAESDPNVRYASPELGLSFMYPEQRYEVRVHRSTVGTETWSVLILTPQGAVPQAGSEGPPAVTIQAIPNLTDIPLETWIREDQRSNFGLSPDGLLAPTVVGGRMGLAYRHSGLYETDAVVVAHNNTMYVFAAGWLTAEDDMRRDFTRLLETVEFLP